MERLRLFSWDELAPKAKLNLQASLILLLHQQRQDLSLPREISRVETKTKGKGKEIAVEYCCKLADTLVLHVGKWQMMPIYLFSCIGEDGRLIIVNTQSETRVIPSLSWTPTSAHAAA